MTGTAPAEPRQEYNAFVAGCPARQLYDRISDKWVGLIMSALAEDAMRYGDLSRKIDGVSQKMLTQTLRNLERDGLVSRTVVPTRPVQVTYALTQLGQSLLPVVRAVKGWAEGHIDQVNAARTTYDNAS
ncbi:winged helix-turn-helix transcriptional regulator [Spirillospora sp. CA-294931]|uniref:winged helix-turn-helix transcriptional regulator n=1 Tax=Spirillospora sp. CA-294931 TaxID=3240042 RepID=UPI003D8A3D19